MVLSSYTEFISLAVAINLASVFIDPPAVSISGFHELINKRLTESIERFSKLSLTKLMPAILLKEKIQFSVDGTLYETIKKSISKIELDFSELISECKEHSQRICSVTNFSQANLYLAFYAFLVLFIAPMDKETTNDSLFIFNIFSVLVYVFILIFEVLKMKWRFRTTLYSIALGYALFLLLFMKSPNFLSFSNEFYEKNIYFSLLFPFTSYFVYLFKGIIGTELIVRYFQFKMFRYDIMSKIKTFTFMAEANSVIVEPIDENSFEILP